MWGWAAHSPHANLTNLPSPLLEALQGQTKRHGDSFKFDAGGFGAGDSRADVAEVKEMLGHIPPDCAYGDWVAVLMALHAHFEGSAEGLSIADVWSARGAKYREGEVATKWRGFHSGGGAGIGTACGAAPTDLTAKVGKAWLISAVARALNPGCKADCAIVFEGKQGVGKSSILRVLAGPDWFHDGLSDMHGKDACAALRGKWIIELPELSAMRRSDTEAVKAFLSRTEERYRPAYGRAEVIEPRRCVFAGTTNRSDYLTDDTGGRRFWPVVVGAVQLEALIRDRDQIWAEAVALYRSGANWWLVRADENAAAAVVATRATDDPWAADVLRVVDGLSEVSTRDVFQLLDIGLDQRSKSNAMRIVSVLTREGWTNDGRFTGGPSKGLTRMLPPPKEGARGSETYE